MCNSGSGEGLAAETVARNAVWYTLTLNFQFLTNKNKQIK
jgi:hypothetical protein